ncbi:sulfatase-like hydrolase/transferase [Termitidicoccus mucosus]
MNRRDFIKTGLTSGALAATGGGNLLAENTGSPPASPVAKPFIKPMPSRPNILYIILEDIGPQLECHGEPLVRTPSIDALAASGIRFSNTFCTAPVSSASRSALMTGCYQIATGCHNHRTWPWDKKPLPAPARHICDWFREAGYFTCNIQPSPKERKDRTLPRTAFRGARGNGKLDLNFSVSGPTPGDPFDGIDWTERAPGQPFFAHITIIETHTGTGWVTARQQPKTELVNPNKLKLPPYFPDHKIARDEYANYLDAIHLGDGYVGQLLARLEKDGLANNTIVIFSSDHGALFRGKQFLYDNGIRIPLIIRFPDGRGAATVDDRLVSGVDLAPTMLGLAGIVLPPGATHGRDLFDSAQPPRDHVFAGRDRMDETVDRMRAVRTARFKYIKNYLPGCPYMQYNAYKETNYPTWNLVGQMAREGTLAPEAALFAAPRKPIEELYDIEADPHEVRNLASDPAHADTLKKLRVLVDDWVRDTNDRGAIMEDPVNTYRGYRGHLPEDTPAKKPDYSK